MSCLLGALLVAVLGLGPGVGCGGFDTVGAGAPPGSTTGVGAGAPPGSTTGVGAGAPPGSTTESKPLAGKVVVLDPGHQLGNHNFPAQINRPVPAGGFTKPCNTTGTATDGGYAEATFTWQVATRLKAELRREGATVVLTRHSNREDRWGPCVDVRGRAGNARHADLKISIHGDGSTAPGAHGFHVIRPPSRRPWTDDIAQPSRRLALATRAALTSQGFSVANYIAGGDGLDVRSDLGTLNLSDVPTVMVELGNMRDRGDASVMASAKGQSRYARALALAARDFLG